MANIDRNALVAAYDTLKGEGITADADEVNTKQPFSFLSTCMRAKSDAVVQRRSIGWHNIGEMHCGDNDYYQRRAASCHCTLT